MRKRAGLSILFLAFLCISNSAYSKGVWKSYTVANGLAGGNIRAMLEDKDGNLWIATNGDGVSRYDGEEFRTLSTEDGLANNAVRAILEDSRGDLWFATGAGVCKYDGRRFGTVLDHKAGLVDNFATSIIEDREGNLWFGTKGGVSRYDGKWFENFTTENGLAHDFVWTILEDSKGNLWFGTEYGGVSKYDGRRFENFTTEDGLAGNWVRTILEDSKGNLWFGTGGSGVSRYDGKRFENFTAENGLAGGSVRSILEDSEGNLWFGTGGGGVSRYDGRDFQRFTSRDGLVGDSVNAICEDREGNLWFGTWGYGISKYDSRIQHYLEDKIIQCVLEDRIGNLWFGTRKGSVFRYDSKAFQNLTNEVGPTGGEPSAILEDSNGILWFTGLSGMARYNGGAFQKIEDIGLSGAVVDPLFEDSQGNLWVSIWKSEAANKIGRYDGERFHHFPVKSGVFPASAEDRTVLEDRTGNIWFVTEEKGIYRYTGTSLVYFTIDDGLAGIEVSSVLEDRSGNLWFGIRNNDGPDAPGVGGLSMYSDVFSIEPDYQADLDRGSIQEGLRQAFRDNGCPLPQNAGVIVKTPGQRWLIRKFLFSIGEIYRGDLDNGRLSADLEHAFVDNGLTLSQSIVISMGQETENYWLIADRGNKQAYSVWQSGAKLNVYESGQTYVIMRDNNELSIFRFFNYSTKDGLGNDSVTGVMLDSNGNLWFRTYHGGVTKYDGRSFKTFRMRDGLAGNTIRAMIEGGDGCLWFGSQGAGVSRYDGRNFQTLTKEDGLLNDTAFVALADRKGSVWLRYSIAGLTKYTPCRDIRPQVVITQVVAETTHQVTPDRREVHVPSKTRVEFHYKGLTLNQFGNILYNCKLEGYDRIQIPMREGMREYENLRPGIYEFQVTAIDRDMNYSDPKSVKLIVVPPFYERPKYIILSAIGLFALCLLIYEFFTHRRNAIKLEEELQKREELERQRITRELQDAHDMQMKLMSEPPPPLPEFDIFGECKPAREVGGDFFRCICLGQDEKLFAITLGDVSGKGMKAAITAVLADGMLHSETRFWWFTPGEFLSELNKGLYERKTDEIMFVAFCFASVDAEQKMLQFSNAGQPWPLIKRDGEVITIAESSGFPLGMMPDTVYGERDVMLEPGDTIVFFTDGITEALNPQDELYTPERLVGLLENADPGLSAEQLADEIFRDVDTFAGEADQYDDMTIVVLKVNGKGGGDIDG